MITLRLWLDFANAACRSAFEELPERLAGHSYSVDYLPAGGHPTPADTAASHADKPGATPILSIGVDPDALSRWACACRFEAAAVMAPPRLGLDADASLPRIEWGGAVFSGSDALKRFLCDLAH